MNKELNKIFSNIQDAPVEVKSAYNVIAKHFSVPSDRIHFLKSKYVEALGLKSLPGNATIRHNWGDGIITIELGNNYKNADADILVKTLDSVGLKFGKDYKIVASSTDNIVSYI